MHIKLSLALIDQRTGLDEAARHRLITDAGGVQPYVWWLGIGLTAVAIAAGIMEAPVPVKPPSSGAPAQRSCVAAAPPPHPRLSPRPSPSLCSNTTPSRK